MKKTLLLLGLIFLLTSCDDDSSYINQQEIINLENIESTNSQSTSLIDMSYEDQLNAFIENDNSNIFFSEFINSIQISSSRIIKIHNYNHSNPSSRGVVNNPPAPSCNTDFYFSNPVVLNTEWDYSAPNFGEHTSNVYTDYYLEQFFRSNWRFNLNWYVKPAPVLLEQVTTGVVYADGGYEDIMTGEQVYDILGDPVSAANGEYVLQELACSIKQYMEDNHPNSSWTHIYDVNLVCDFLLTPNSTITRAIRAEFKVAVY
ncbi:MAG: hypothetical protein PSN34_14285 [Urechidicola sp.]|nr:hypothetical protein [Urechidicola sp.]